MAATVVVVEERGYGAMTVADLVEISGVSRSAFYRHFANREACFLATAEEIVALTLQIVGNRYRHDRPWEERARDALATFFSLVAEQPAAARLILVETYGAGPEALAVFERATAGFEVLAYEAVAQLPGREGMPPQMVRALIGGLRELVQTRLQRREEARLVDLVPDLLQAALAHRTPPPTLLAQIRRNRSSCEAPAAPRKVEPIDGDQAERIIAAATRTMATKGYAATPLNAVVAEAGVSLSTLYEHFDRKQDLLAAALDAGQARMFAAAGPAYRRSRDWPEGIRNALGATLRFLSHEPHFARLATVEIYGAGPWALERRAHTVERFARFLAPGFERSPEATPVAAELAIGSVLSLIFDWVRSGRHAVLPELAPLATYVLLSPFLGTGEAGAVAVGERAGVAPA